MIPIRINKPGFLFQIAPKHNCEVCGKPLADEEMEFYEAVYRDGRNYITPKWSFSVPRSVQTSGQTVWRTLKVHIKDETRLYVCSFDVQSSEWTVIKTRSIGKLIDRYYLGSDGTWTGSKREHFADLPEVVINSMFGFGRLQTPFFVIPA